MAELPLLAHGNLVISPKGRTYDMFKGFYLPSIVELVDSEGRMYLGQLVNGYEMLDELPIFLDECGTEFSYEDNSDGDLPSNRLSLSCRTILTGVATIKIRTEKNLPDEEPSTWTSEVDKQLRRSARLGAVAYEASADENGPVLILLDNLTLHASDHHLREFVRQLVAELHATTNPVPLRLDPPPSKPPPQAQAQTPDRKRIKTMGELDGGHYPQLIQKHQLIERGLLTGEQAQAFMNHPSDQLMPPSVERTAAIIEKAEFPEEP